MQNFGELIRTLREKEGFPLRKLAAFLDIDQAVLSKIERGKRKFSREQVIKLSQFFNYDQKEMLIAFLSDRIISEIGDEEFAKEALIVAEEKIEYQVYKTLDREKILFAIKNTLKQFSKISKAWIFGSFSREDDNQKSDIDIAICADEGFSYFDLAEIQYQIEKDIKRKVDIGFIGTFKTHIIKNIENDLKLIYER